MPKISEATRQKNAARGAQWYQLNKAGKALDARYRRQYGISLEAAEALLASQDFKCSICAISLPEFVTGKGGANVDHCHQTGKVRGILCGKCNKGLGMFDDSRQTVSKALAYLEYHSGAQDPDRE